MCVAGLNVSTQPCNHRWVQLVRSCDSQRDLANCPDRLKLEGWEVRNEGCPWCEDQAIPASTHRLFGSTSSTTSTGPSPTSPVLSAMGTTRQYRSGSGGTLSSLSRNSSTASESAQRHRDMNDRIHLYLVAQPHEVLPSARKNYPTYPTSRRDESPESDCASIASASGILSKGWRKSVKLGKGMFKG